MYFDSELLRASWHSGGGGERNTEIILNFPTILSSEGWYLESENFLEDELKKLPLFAAWDSLIWKIFYPAFLYSLPLPTYRSKKDNLWLLLRTLTASSWVSWWNNFPFTLKISSPIWNEIICELVLSRMASCQNFAQLRPVRAHA